jgi:hypothetical protein
VEEGRLLAAAGVGTVVELNQELNSEVRNARVETSGLIDKNKAKKLGLMRDQNNKSEGLVGLLMAPESVTKKLCKGFFCSRCGVIFYDVAATPMQSDMEPHAEQRQC